MGVDDPHPRSAGGDALEQTRHGRACGARDVERRPLRRQVERGVDPLDIDGVARGRHRSVPPEGEAPPRDLLDRLERALVVRPVTHERRVDAVRHGIAERQGVGRQEQRARRDRKSGDDDGALGWRTSRGRARGKSAGGAANVHGGSVSCTERSPLRLTLSSGPAPNRDSGQPYLGASPAWRPPLIRPTRYVAHVAPASFSSAAPRPDRRSSPNPPRSPSARVAGCEPG